MTIFGLTVSDIASLVAATGGLIAAVAAGLSAATARKSGDRAAAIDKRSQIREAVTLSNSIVADTIRVDELANQLKQLHKTGEFIAGQSGGSRQAMTIKAVEQKQSGIGPIQNKSREVVENWRSLEEKSDTSLTELLAELDGYLVQVRRVKEKFLHDIETIRSDIDDLRNT